MINKIFVYRLNKLFNTLDYFVGVDKILNLLKNAFNKNF